MAKSNGGLIRVEKRVKYKKINERTGEGERNQKRLKIYTQAKLTFYTFPFL